jgi:hypothetical protein
MPDAQALNWQVENLRLTAFPSPSTPFDLQANWWTDLTGEQPENTEHRARQGILKQEGWYQDNLLVLLNQPDRVNWLFAAPEVDEETILPIIGPFDDLLNIFQPLMLRWFELDTCPPLSRLAFGAVLLFPVDTRQLGYQQLDRLLPYVDLSAEGISDFAYQINRPRDANTQIENLRINRLSKWRVFRLRQHFLTGHNIERVLPAQEVFACRLELDINTHQDFSGELPPEQLSEVFDELVNLGREIARDGDVE